MKRILMVLLLAASFISLSPAAHALDNQSVGWWHHHHHHHHGH